MTIDTPPRPAELPAPPPPPPDVAPPVNRARQLWLGGAIVVLGLIMLLGFGIGSPSGVDSRFVLNQRGARWNLSDLVVPTRPITLILAVAVLIIGAVELIRGFQRWSTTVLGVTAVLFVAAFLIWAARDDSLNLIGLFTSAVLGAVPIAIGAMAGILCERSGVINIAIEGMMLSAAFTGAITASAFGNLWLGLLCAILAGAVMGAALAVLSIRYKVNQIVAGTVLNIFALGMTSFLSAQILQDNQDLNSPGVFRPWDIPLLHDIPIAGPLLFSNNLFVYVMFILVVVLQIGIFKTRWGLRLRAVGEHPRAADTVGIKVLRVRYRSVMLGGAVAGLAGAYFTLGSVGRFDENMTAGRGFIALAAVIFGRWKPTGALAAALLFGFAEALKDKLSIVDSTIPSDFLLMAPYLATILAVAGVVGASRGPAAAGQVYETG